MRRIERRRNASVLSWTAFSNRTVLLANRLLQQFAVVNVGAGSIPPAQLPVVIVYRNGPGPKPSILAAFCRQSIFRFVDGARFHRRFPSPRRRHRSSGWTYSIHAKPLRRFGSTRIFIKPLAEIVPVSFRSTAENHVGRRAHDGVQFRFFCFSARFRCCNAAAFALSPACARPRVVQVPDSAPPVRAPSDAIPRIH